MNSIERQAYKITRKIKMRHTLFIIIIFTITTFTAPVFGQQDTVNQAESWETDFTSALQKRKAQTSGLGYSISEEIFLEQEMTKALDKKAPPCQVMKIAIDLKYPEFEVIKNIFSHGSELDLDQLCMCANEKKIPKDILAMAINYSKTPYAVDELTQAQCIEVYGYGTDPGLPERIIPPGPVPPVSAASPGGTGQDITELP